MQLVKCGELKRFRGHVDDEYIYYTRQQPKEIQHMLWRVDAYIQLNEDYNLVEFIPEFNYYGIRADAYFEVWQNGFTTGYFLEIQKSHQFNIQKYEKPYQSEEWMIKWNKLPYIIFKTDLKLNYKDNIVTIKVFKINQRILL
jgi:hypothetical protein